MIYLILLIALFICIIAVGSNTIVGDDWDDKNGWIYATTVIGVSCMVIFLIIMITRHMVGHP